MEKEYNWKAILYGAIPSSIFMIFVFSSGFSSGLKWFYLVIGMLIALGITYRFNRKKQNIFTSAFVVVIVTFIVHGLRNLGLL